jgi:hypothetical protein
MTPRRRDDDVDDDGALSRRARPTWQVLTLIGSILVAAGLGVAAAQTVANSEAQKVVAPVERKIDDHLAAVVPTRELMEAFVDEQRQFNRDARRQLEALCRASPHANCPLSGGR